MICQICQDHQAAFERGNGPERLGICYSCLTRTGLHLVEGWRMLPLHPKIDPCPDCGLEQDEYLNSGRYGCGTCHGQFGSLIRELRAAIPADGPRLPEEADLSLALLLEDYELAARIRDQQLGEQDAG